VTIVARPTEYAGVKFRSRLEARWACFFDLLEWQWEYEPFDFNDWVPDFGLSFSCGHSECAGRHRFFAEVKPYEELDEFKNHSTARHIDDFGDHYGRPVMWLGNNPNCALAIFSHGAGGGMFTGPNLFEGFSSTSIIAALVWREAGNVIQWKPEHRS
jgi:hypothetical protein